MDLPVEQRREWIKSRREQRKLTRHARLRRQVLRYLLLSVLFAAGVGAFCYSSWSISNNAEQISIRGNKVASNEQIKSVLKDSINSPIYQLDPKILENRVLELSIIKQAFVRRYAFPHPRIVVEVMEEFPWACFGTDPDASPEWVICESGKLISIAEFPHVIQPPLQIYGSSTLRLANSDVAQWASWITLIEKQTKTPVTSVDLRDPLNVTAQDGDLLLKLGSPDTTLTKRIARLASVQLAIKPLDRDIEYIDLGLDNNIPVKVAKKVDKNGRLVRLPL
jgi:cell division septal protein FtsQ